MGRWRKWQDDREGFDEPRLSRKSEPLFAQPASPETRAQIEATERSFQYGKAGQKGWSRVSREKAKAERLEFYRGQMALPAEKRIGKMRAMKTGDFSQEEIAEMERLYGRKGK